jgi:hypothetical protein
MKLLSSKSAAARGARAFTLIEALVTSVALVLIMGSVIACNLFGVAMAARQQMWLGASDDSARCLGLLAGDIRSATSMEVGSYSNNIFTAAAATGQQSGNALLLYTNSTSNQWVIYYYYSATNYYGGSNLLMRTNYDGVLNVGDYKFASANEITNDATHPIFTEVDWNGTPYSNSQPWSSVSVYLSFTKLQDPQIVIENGSAVDLYQIVTTISPRLRL